jgi:hypothetical protein
MRVLPIFQSALVSLPFFNWCDAFYRLALVCRFVLNTAMATRSTQAVQGVLHKRGHKVKNWKKRYFVLGADNKTVAYYTDKDLKVRKGSVTVTKVFDLPDRKDKRSFRFDFVGHQDGMEDEITLCVSAESVDEKYKWIQAVEGQVDIKQVAKSIHYNLYQEQVAQSNLMGPGADDLTHSDLGLSDLGDDEFDGHLHSSLGSSMDMFNSLNDSSGSTSSTSSAGSKRFSNMSMPSITMPQSSRNTSDISASVGKNSQQWVPAGGSRRSVTDLAGGSTRMSEHMRLSKVGKRMSATFGTTASGEMRNYLPAKLGFLQMKVSIRPARWKEYFFVFDGDNRILSWYSDKEQTKMKGYMEMLVIYDIPNRPHKTPFRMEYYGVHKNQNKGYLSCSAVDEHDKTAWMDVIKNHVTFKNSNDFYNAGLEAVPVWQSKPTKAMKTVAQKFAYNRSDQESPASLQLRLKAAGGLIIAPLTATAILMATLVSPNRTKDTMVDQALNMFSISKRLDINITDEQDERINLAVKIGIIQGDFPQAAKILWEVLQEVLRDPKNKSKIHDWVDRAVDLCVNVVGQKIGPPFELVAAEVDLLKAAVFAGLEGDMASASENARLLGVLLLADKNKVNKVMDMLSVFAQERMGMDPAIVEILFAQQLDVVEKLAEGNMKVDFQKVFDIAFKVKVELLQYLEKAVFLPGLMNGCGGEYNMPLVVEEQLNKVGTVIWNEIKFDIDTVVAGAVNEASKDTDPKEGRQRNQSTLRANPFIRLRAWFLYRWYPYDKNLWTKANDFWWIMFNLILCSPFASLRIFFYSMLFSSIDRRDEFQLVNYIRSFKAYHFLSTGVMGMCVGCLQYIRCVNFADKVELAPGEDACSKNGPGAAIYYYVEIACFFFNVFVVWIAFWMLKKSKRVLEQGRIGDSGESTAWVNLEVSGSKISVRNEEWETREERNRAWGVLKYLLYFDLGCFIFLIVACGAAVMLTFGFDGANYKEERDMWKIRALLYWMRCFYGICALPFMLFLLPFEGPLFSKMITHAKVTAYDQYGNLRLKQIRPMYLHLKISGQSFVHELADPANDELVEAIDATTADAMSESGDSPRGHSISNPLGEARDGIERDGIRAPAAVIQHTDSSQRDTGPSITALQHSGDFKFAMGQVRAHRTITAFQQETDEYGGDGEEGEEVMGYNYQEFCARTEEDMKEWVRVIQVNVDVETEGSDAFEHEFKEGYLMCPIMKGGKGFGIRCYKEKPRLMRRWVEVDGNRVTLFPTRAGAMAARKRHAGVTPRERSRSAFFSNTAVDMYEHQKAAEELDARNANTKNPMHEKMAGGKPKKRTSILNMMGKKPTSPAAEDDADSRMHAARTVASASELESHEVMI